jgi:hypothetical protein
MVRYLVFAVTLLASAWVCAAPVQYVGSGQVVGNDGIERCVRISMTFEDKFNKLGSAPPLEYNFHDSYGHFQIYTYLVEVEGMGVYSGANGRLNIWLDQSPASQHFYTEELEVLEKHSLMRFYDGAGNPYTWTPWLGASPVFELPPELVVTRLNITPGYSFDLGNDIHLYPVPCRCLCNRAKFDKWHPIKPSPKCPCSCKKERASLRLSGIDPAL